MSDADPRRAGAVLEIDALARDPRRIDGIARVRTKGPVRRGSSAGRATDS